MREPEEPGIDRVADGGASEPQRIFDGAGLRGNRILLVVQHVVIVQLEDERNRARKLSRGCLEESQRRRVGVASRVERELEVIGGVIRRRIDGEAARRAVLEALVNRQDDELAGAGEAPRHHHPREVGKHAGVLAGIVTENFFDSLGHHVEASPLRRGSFLQRNDS